MATEKTVGVSPAPRRRRKWLRVLVWVACAFVALLVAVYFIATSSGFLKSVILPRVSAAVNADITVSDASIHPFGSVTLRDLKVQPKGQETLLTAPEVRARYSLLDIIGGNINVDEVTLTSPTIHLVQNADGSSNLDPLLKGQQEEKGKPEEKPSKPSQPSKAPKLNIRNVTVHNASFRQEKIYNATHRDVTEITNVNVSLDKLRNADSGKLTISAGAAVRNNPPGAESGGALQAQLQGEYLFAISSDLKPQSVKGSSTFAITRAEGGFADLAALGASLDCDVAPGDIRQVVLRFQKAGQPLGEVRAGGPFDAEKMEGRLRVDVVSLDKRVLNLVGASSGVDFGTTRIDCTNELQFANGGAVIALRGNLAAAKIQLIRGNQTTPTLDIRADYDVNVNQTEKNALLRGFTINGTQNGSPMLHATLTQPMNISWSGSTNSVGNSSLNVALTSLNLADWKAFVGDVVPSGMVNAQLALVSQQGGNHLTFDANSKIENLTVIAGSNQITQASISLKASGEARDMKQFNLTEYNLQVAQQGEPAISVSGSGIYNDADKSADMQILLRIAFARLAQLAPQAGLAFSSGSAELRGQVIQKQNIQTVVGKFTLSDLTGQMASTEFRAFGAGADLDIRKAADAIEIRKLSGSLSSGTKPGGSFNVTGAYDLAKQSGRVEAKLSDFNQDGIGPFLQSALGEKQLVSVHLAGLATADYNPQGDSAVKADLQVTNLVVNDPANQIPATPLEAKVRLDASLRNQVVDLRQFLIGLTPTDRATNVVQLAGRVDMSNSNALSGSLKLAADSIDVTRYYDLFTGEKTPQKKSEKPAEPKPRNRRAQQTGGTTATTTPAPRQEEPAAVNLPVRNFTVELNIGSLYLRELAISNWQTALKVDGGHVVVSPFQLAINNAPVTAKVDLNLGVPGYQYDVNFHAAGIPVAPLANSFSPDYRDQAKGDLSAELTLKGAGITGTSMRTNLGGEANVVFTNANIKLVGEKIHPIVAVIATALRVPETADAPINWLVANVKIADGKINLTQCQLAGEAYSASSQGVISIARVLTNSTIENIPIEVALSRSLAHRAGIKTASSDPNAAYVNLGRVAHVEGKLGDPKAKADAARIAVLTAGSLVGGEAGQILRGLGGVAPSGQSADQGTNSPAPGASTNPPPPSKPSAGSIINDLLGPKRKR